MTGSRSGPWLRALVSVLAVAGAHTPIGASDSPLPVAAYIARLDALASALEDPGTAARAAALVHELPDILSVEGSPRRFEIPITLIRRDVHAWETAHDEAARRRVLRQVRTMRTEAARFEEPAVAPSAERALLTGILDGREFRDAHGPTWIDRLRQRAFELIASLFGQLFGRSAIPTIGRVLVYGLMALAAVVAALAALRFIRRNGAAEPIRLGAPAGSPADWPFWLSEAQAAAAGGRWRDAIHFTYWCSITFLEKTRAWRPDRARTPREYLRLLPSSSDDGAALLALTRRFELVWYGQANADAEAFTESIAHLKKLGCPAA